MKANFLRWMSKCRFLSDRKRLEWYPPFWFMRIKVVTLSADWRHIQIKLPLNFLSRNMGDGMFGGYQTALADPIAALACNRVLDRKYNVWSRYQEVDFRYIGNSDLQLRFDFDSQIEQQIRADLKTKGRSTPTFEYGFYRADGVECTHIKSTVAIRAMDYKPPLS
ncbi:hypothetical protein MNBD_GAMMA23-1405 [hydrothermal vent metagenome]|uniref:Thioesterase putative domain-containing protein n=1 Tax=hydrothermal vent metagenome TaxID=652676 RepID=A0A3B1AVZ7_9ZZZZ